MFCTSERTGEADATVASAVKATKAAATMSSAVLVDGDGKEQETEAGRRNGKGGRVERRKAKARQLPARKEQHGGELSSSKGACGRVSDRRHLGPDLQAERVKVHRSGVMSRYSCLGWKDSSG